MQDHLAKELERFTQELGRKYGVPAHEIEDDISEFLEEKYGPAKTLAARISGTEHPVILFIGREDCTICKRCRPDLEIFLENHDDIELFKVDYAEPEGLLYHIIKPGDKGLLPMIALIYEGCIKVLYTGECVLPETYENYYLSTKSEGGPKYISPRGT